MPILFRVPIQLNSREENAQIKAGQHPEGWSENKQCQKDTEARWTKKNGKSSFGYKNHISVDVKHKLIRRFHVTSAKVHDRNLAESGKSLRSVGFFSHFILTGGGFFMVRAVWPVMTRKGSWLSAENQFVSSPCGQRGGMTTPACQGQSSPGCFIEFASLTPRASHADLCLVTAMERHNRLSPSAGLRFKNVSEKY